MVYRALFFSLYPSQLFIIALGNTTQFISSVWLTSRPERRLHVRHQQQTAGFLSSRRAFIHFEWQQV